MRRVAITGMGIVSPIGNDMDAVEAALKGGKSGIRAVPAWKVVKGLHSLVAGVVEVADPTALSRQHRRTMGRLAVLGALAARDAVACAALTKDLLSSGRAGVAFGSTTGSPSCIERFFREYWDAGGIKQHEGTLFMRVMSHTVAANVAGVLGIRGQLIAPCSACVTSTQAIGLGYEIVRSGQQDVMVCGGAEEIHPTTAGVFDILGAASRAYNDTPERTPRPFDADRDGLVVSEGAAAIVLEDYEDARARGAEIYAELLGYATCCDVTHMTQPNKDSMLQCMTQALESAGVSPQDLDYINAHATGTVLGDATEAEATRQLVGRDVRVSSTKGHTGHSLAACGAMEVIFCTLLMMRHGFLAPTLNLERVAPDCEGLAHVTELTGTRPRLIMSSNFAFGGVSASLVVGAP